MHLHTALRYTSNKANPFSDMYAMEGLDLILSNIEKSCDDPAAMKAKNCMQDCSILRRTCDYRKRNDGSACTELSARREGYHIAHGVFNAILLAPYRVSTVSSRR